MRDSRGLLRQTPALVRDNERERECVCVHQSGRHCRKTTCTSIPQNSTASRCPPPVMYHEHRSYIPNSTIQYRFSTQLLVHAISNPINLFYNIVRLTRTTQTPVDILFCVNATIYYEKRFQPRYRSGEHQHHHPTAYYISRS